MSCWGSKPGTSSDTESRYTKTPAEIPPSDTHHLSTPTPTMAFRNNGQFAGLTEHGRSQSSSDYDTPPWRVDQPKARSSSESAPIVTTWNDPVYVTKKQHVPDVTSWKIGPPLLPTALGLESDQKLNMKTNASNGVNDSMRHNDYHAGVKGNLENGSNGFDASQVEGHQSSQNHSGEPELNGSISYPVAVSNGHRNVLYESVSSRSGSISTRTESYSPGFPISQINGHKTHSTSDSETKPGSPLPHQARGVPRKRVSEWAWRPAHPDSNFNKMLPNRTDQSRTVQHLNSALPRNGSPFRKYEYKFENHIDVRSNGVQSDDVIRPEDYVNKIFEDAGLPGLPDFSTINNKGSVGPMLHRGSSGDTMGSSGYGSLTSPLLSPFSPATFPTPAVPTLPLNNNGTIKSRKSRVMTDDKQQDIDTLANKCLDAGVLFRDTEFPASSRSLYYCRPPPVQGPVEWKRPFEICGSPQFISGGSDRFDVVQGSIGDCWLVSAIAGLTLNQKMLNKVCPSDQTFNKKYSGSFKFRFWRFGKWRDVVVDDRLPTVGGKLVYLSSSQPDEFWSALLEKAYAKLMGSYEALDGGNSSEAFTDFTGGIVESLNLRDNKNHWNIIQKAYRRGSFMGCGIDATPGVLEQKLANGLVCGHAYTVTSIKQFQIPGSGRALRLIRLRNPWGSKHEWTGAWSDRSIEWQRMPQSFREEIGLSIKADGEFWMSFEDFRSNFNTVDMCHLPPDAADGRDQWKAVQHDGAWEPGVTAGGCSNYRDTLTMNPQYRVTLSEPDDDDADGLCTLIVSMTQKYRRKGASDGSKNLTVGYSILKVPPGIQGPITSSTLGRCEPVGNTPPFINSRDISHRHELGPGDYVIIPSTYKPNVKGEFLLRIYTEKTAAHLELDEETDFEEKKSNDSFPELNAQTPVERKKIESMRETFDLLAGEDGEINAWELLKAINLMFSKEFGGFEGFGIEVARSLIARNDGDMTGNVNKEEFMALWQDLSLWKNAFKDHDVDETGTLDIQELRNVMKQLGFKLNNKMLVAISRRFSNRRGQIDVTDFVLCLCRLHTMIRTFQAHQSPSGSEATIPKQEFMLSTIYS